MDVSFCPGVKLNTGVLPVVGEAVKVADNRVVQNEANRLSEPVWLKDDEVLEDGEGLISYFTSMADLRRRAASFVDKIFKGANPGELPVEQP